MRSNRDAHVVPAAVENRATLLGKQCGSFPQMYIYRRPRNLILFCLSPLFIRSTFSQAAALRLITPIFPFVVICINTLVTTLQGMSGPGGGGIPRFPSRLLCYCHRRFDFYTCRRPRNTLLWILLQLVIIERNEKMRKKSSFVFTHRCHFQYFC